MIAGDVLAGTAPTSARAAEAQRLIEDALDTSWDIEGALLNDVSDTLELGVKGVITSLELKRQTADRRVALRTAFTLLKETAARAADVLGRDDDAEALGVTTSA